MFLYCLDNVVGHEWFPVVLSDVPIGHEAGLAAQVPGELAAVVVLHDDRVPGVSEDVKNCIAVERHEPTDLELICGNAFLSKNLTSLFDHTFRRAPADQRDISVTRTPQHRRRHRSFNAGNFPHALFHHGAALGRVREFVTDQDAIFIVFIAGGSVGITGKARNGTRRNTAFGDFVTFVTAVSIPRGCRGGISDQLAAVDERAEVQILRINAEPAFRQQEIAENDARDTGSGLRH